MHLRRTVTPLILAAVLVTPGCVSVPAGPPAPGPSLAPAAVRSPVRVPALPQQPVGREELAATGPDDSAPKKKQVSAVRERVPRTPPREPAARPGERADVAPPKARTPRRTAPKQPRWTPKPTRRTPKTPWRTPKAKAPEMRTLCRAADGVTNSAVVQLCRDTYGR